MTSLDDVTNPLLPDRHRQQDFFVLDIMDAMPRDDMASMGHPLFALRTNAAKDRFMYYQRGEVELRVVPSSAGLPTIFDKDILIYCISQLMARKNQGLAVGPLVKFNAHDLLVATNRPLGGESYERLLAACQRLAGALITTTVKTGGRAGTHGFHLIEEFFVKRPDADPMSGRMQWIEITLADWMMRAIEANEVLAIHRDYFRLRKAADRRLYELARKHCGSEQKHWQIGLGLLKEKMAYGSHVRNLKAHVRIVEAHDHLPDYAVRLDGDTVVVTRKMATLRRPVGAEPGLTVARLDQVLGDDGLDQAAAKARAKNWDLQVLKAQFIAMAAAKGEPIRNHVGAFLGFIDKKPAHPR